MAKSRGRKLAELDAPTNGVFAAASIPTIALSKLASSTFSVNSESASLGGNVVLDSNDITEHTSAKYFTNARAQQSISVASNSGHGALSYDNSNGQFTFAGITTEAIQDLVGAMFSSNTETAVTVTYQDSDGTIDLIVDDTTKVPLAGGTMTGNLTLGDNVNAYFGASTDLRIYHDGTNSHIINSTGELRFTGSNFAIKSDSAKLYFGASDDLQIYHDGSHSYIKDAGTGNLILNTQAFRVNGADDAEGMIKANQDGNVELYYDGSKKFETNSGGVTVTGTLSANKLVSLDGVLELDDNGTHNGIINSPASLRVNIDSDNGGTGESFAVGHNQTSINANNKLFEVNESGQVTINSAFTFPTSDGTNGQVLQTNGSGVLSWSTAAGGSSVWSSSGSNIYYTSGNVGIGTSSLTNKFHVSGNARIEGNIMAGAASATNVPVTAIHIKSSGTNAALRIEDTTSSNLVYDIKSTHGTGLSIIDQTAVATRMLIDSSGNVGIGTNNPASILHIEGNTNGYNTSPLLYFGSTSTANAGVRDWAIGPADSAYGNFHIFRGASTGASPIGTAGTVFTIDNAGQVGLGGLGYFAPAAPLHINSSNNQHILLSGSASPYIRWQEGSTNKAYIQWNAGGWLDLVNEEVSSTLRLDDNLILYPTTDEAFVIQRSGSALRQKIFNTSTTGTYSYLQLTTVNSGSTQNSGYIIKNAAQGAGNGLANNSLYIWNQTNEVELVPAGTIAKRLTVDGNGDLTVRGGGTLTGQVTINKESTINTTTPGGTATYGLHFGGQSTADSATGITFSAGNATSTNANAGIYVQGSGAYGTKMYLATTDSYSSGSKTALQIDHTGLATFIRQTPKVNANVIWHAGNDGPGSGLDADTLDTLQASQFLRSDANDSTSGILTTGQVRWGTGNSYSGNARSVVLGYSGGNYGAIGYGWHPTSTSGQHTSQINDLQSRIDLYNGIVVYGSGSAQSVGSTVSWTTLLDCRTNAFSYKGNSIWHAGNDGPNSGLNADLLDGSHSSAFATLSGSNSFSNSYNEFGNATGSVSNDGSWNGRVNVAGNSHARLDVKAVGDGIVGTMYAHNGHSGPRFGSMSNHQVDFMINGAVKSTLSTAGSLSTTQQGTLWGSGNDGPGSGLDADTLDTIQGRKIQEGLARIAGWEPGYSNNTEASVYYDYGERAIVIDGANDSNNGAVFKAVRVEAGDKLQFTVQVKGSGASSSGMYLRLYVYNGELPNGKTHVSNDASGSTFVQEDSTGDTSWYENGAVSTSYVSFSRSYTATQTSFVSLVVLNWGGHGTKKLYVRNPDLVHGKGRSDRFITGGLYGTGHGSSLLPVWQYNAANTGYGFGYTEGSPDHWDFDVSGQLLSGTPDFSIYPNEVRVNGSTVWHAGNDGSGSGLDADTVDNLNPKSQTGNTSGEQILRSHTNSYFYHGSWIQVGGGGLFSTTTNGAHFMPNNNTSYGTWKSSGAKNGYDGLVFDSGGDVAVMFDSAGNGGFYRQPSSRWFMYHHVGNNCTGINTSGTSASYGLQVVGGIYSDGNIVAYSDRRIKENIVPIDNALEKVNKLAGVYYNKIDDEKKTREIGFIAQEVNEVAPELVTYAEDIDQYGVKYGNTTALLVEAVKELTQQVKDLKQELEELKNG